MYLLPISANKFQLCLLFSVALVVFVILSRISCLWVTVVFYLWKYYANLLRSPLTLKNVYLTHMFVHISFSSSQDGVTITSYSQFHIRNRLREQPFDFEWKGRLKM